MESLFYQAENLPASRGRQTDITLCLLGQAIKEGLLLLAGLCVGLLMESQKTMICRQITSIELGGMIDRKIYAGFQPLRMHQMYLMKQKRKK
jgi:hypothetical protein